MQSENGKTRGYCKNHRIRYKAKHSFTAKTGSVVDFQSTEDLAGGPASEEFKTKGLYHRACIANYLLNSPKKDKLIDELDISEHDKAFRCLVSDMNEDLLHHKKAFLMSFLLEKFCTFLPHDLKTKYTSAKLQRRLEKHYGESIVVQAQKGQGRSNIVFSSSITIYEAIQAASHFKSELKLSKFEREVETPTINEDQTGRTMLGIHQRILVLK
ncbi:unnamed protein product [Mytilus coruscus]|uniref:Uncharacterized protein n=1 Tax=Mytilus coruscus TaxID=42192 RepID=A0A6J8AJQ9_MYTCO|nr:unnamed protein product [Mytilus coruscus]